MRFRRSYSAGKSLESVLPLVRELNDAGIPTSLSYLPVRKNEPESVAEDVSEYRRLLRVVRDERLSSDVTLKPHQLGIYGSRELCLRSIEEVAAEAHRLGNFVWIDMERSATVEGTITIFEELYPRYGNLGICLQAYLRRTEGDMKRLLENRVPLRLVKGFYRDHDIRSWSEVTESYARLMDYLLTHSARPAIATHDLSLVEKARRKIRELGATGAEIQFFEGVRDETARELSREGITTRIYVPYGKVVPFLVKGLFTFDLRIHVQHLLGVRKVR